MEMDHKLLTALVEADASSLHSSVFHDAIQLALNLKLAGCKFSWAAEVAHIFKCFSSLSQPLPFF